MVTEAWLPGWLRRSKVKKVDERKAHPVIRAATRGRQSVAMDSSNGVVGRDQIHFTPLHHSL